MNARNSSFDLQRRKLLYGAVALTAATAGAGAAWWRLRPGNASTAVAPELWALSFDRLEGPPLVMASLRGRPLLVNFWATWCPPCVEELPLLDAFYRQQRGNGWQVLGLAIDQPAAVSAFLARHQVSFPIGLAGLRGADLGKSLGNLSGGLPFTVVLRAGGAIAHRKMGRITPSDLAQWALLT